MMKTYKDPSVNEEKKSDELLKQEGHKECETKIVLLDSTNPYTNISREYQNVKYLHYIV